MIDPKKKLEIYRAHEDSVIIIAEHQYYKHFYNQTVWAVYCRRGKEVSASLCHEGHIVKTFLKVLKSVRKK